MLPRGVHVVTPDIELLSCLRRWHTTVRDKKYILLTTFFFNLFYQGSPRERSLMLAFFTVGFSDHRKSRGILCRLFPRELAITGIRAIVGTSTSHHGNSSRRNRAPRELATTVTQGIFSTALKRPPWGFAGRERANVFVGGFIPINNQYLCMNDT